jgi:hypothetical protein
MRLLFAIVLVVLALLLVAVLLLVRPNPRHNFRALRHFW